MKKYFVLFFVFSMFFGSLGSVKAEMKGKAVEVEEAKIVDEVDEYVDNEEYVSGVLKFDRPVWMIGFKVFVLNESVDFKLSFLGVDGDNVSDWIDSELDIDRYAGGVMYVDPIALDFMTDSVQYRLTGDFSNVEKVELIGLDPYDYDGVAQISGKYQKADQLNVINRDEWGADESIMFWDDDMEHAKVKQIVVHHTAGNENSPLDPAAVVRGIYYYHTVTNGWGDIGYNYVIDQYGNVYEGRKGGIGAVAAHTLGYNSGSVGISILGNYEQTVPSEYAIDGLENVLAFISYQTGVDLTAKVKHTEKTVDMVSGHRDLGATACPGQKFYEILPQVRVEAANLAKNKGVKQFEARLIDLSSNSISLDDGQKQTVKVKYLNTGMGAWLNGYGEVKLVTISPKSRSSKFASSAWESSSVVGEAFRYSIMPNDYAEFDLELKGSNEKGVFTESFALMNAGNILENTSFTVVVDSSGEEYKEKVSNFHGIHPKYYRYEVMENPILNVVEGDKVKVELELKNTGDNNWDKSGLFPMHLGTLEDKDHNSIFYNSEEWLTKNRLEMLQEQVKPGEVGMFSFELAGNLSKGSFVEKYGLVLENISWIDGPVLQLMINVDDARYGAELVGKSSQVPYMIGGEVATVWMDVRNTGNQTWYREGENVFMIGTTNPHDRVSDFYNQDYWFSNNRTTPIKVDSVQPGEVVRMEILLQAPKKTGNFHECFAPVVEGKGWMDQGQVCWDIVVNK